MTPPLDVPLQGVRSTRHHSQEKPGASLGRGNKQTKCIEMGVFCQEPQSFAFKCSAHITKLMQNDGWNNMETKGGFFLLHTCS